MIKKYKEWLGEQSTGPRYLQPSEVPDHVYSVLSNIRHTLVKHGASARLSVQHYPETDHHEVSVELGRHNDNEQLVQDLIKHQKRKDVWSQPSKGEVRISTMESQYPAPKHTV